MYGKWIPNISVGHSKEWRPASVPEHCCSIWEDSWCKLWDCDGQDVQQTQPPTQGSKSKNLLYIWNGGWVGGGGWNVAGILFKKVYLYLLISATLLEACSPQRKEFPLLGSDRIYPSHSGTKSEYILAIQVHNQCFLVQDLISYKIDPQCTRNWYMLTCMFHVILQAGPFKYWYGFVFKN